VKESIPIEQILLQNKGNFQQLLKDSIHDTYDKTKSKLTKSDIEARKLIRAKTRETVKLKIKSTANKKI
jgi:hypothetical protein